MPIQKTDACLMLADRKLLASLFCLPVEVVSQILVGSYDSFWQNISYIHPKTIVQPQWMKEVPH